MDREQLMAAGDLLRTINSLAKQIETWANAVDPQLCILDRHGDVAEHAPHDFCKQARDLYVATLVDARNEVIASLKNLLPEGWNEARLGEHLTNLRNLEGIQTRINGWQNSEVEVMARPSDGVTLKFSRSQAAIKQVVLADLLEQRDELIKTIEAMP